ncbi:Actin-binding protein IPP [Durusdinium trenchii]|uniref:Actin-binding protein IPP n=1 Tax=Durusdinium trenchii TaxID=1381693 RepID=A0ABP0IU47_9DINO
MQPWASLSGSYGPSTWKAEPLSQVLQALQTTQGQLSLLTKRLSMLREEHEALCDCLAFHGAVPAERLLAWMHRRRFAEARRRHPVACHETLESLMQAKELALDLAVRLGLEVCTTLSRLGRS